MSLHLSSRTVAPETAGVTIPYEVLEAVRLWARKWGRFGNVKWHPLLRCAVIELTLPDDDPRMQAFMNGGLRKKPVECVPLHRQNKETLAYEAIPLEALSASGIESLLDEANMWSGRGEVMDLFQAVQKVDEQNEALRKQQRDAVEEAARESAWLNYRQIFKVPLVRGADLKNE